MRLIHTFNGEHYRRWINILISLLFPGSAQYLAGRKTAGLLWFVTVLVTDALILAFLMHPKTSFSVVEPGYLEWIMHLVWLAALVDGARKPICRMAIQGWMVVFLVWSGLVAVFILAIPQWGMQPFKMPNQSMQPTINASRTAEDGSLIDGDHFFVNKFIYFYRRPQRADVVAITTHGLGPYNGAPKIILLKRILGLPGETIHIQPPYIYANGQKLMQPDILREIAQSEAGFQGFQLAGATALLSSTNATMKLGPDEYFVLGDNINNSFDSRWFGPIKRANILGKVTFIYAPTSRKGWIE